MKTRLIIEKETFVFISTSLCICECVFIHRLSFGEGWMLGVDVVLCAGLRFESHGTAGAFVEHITMSLLDVSLH